MKKIQKRAAKDFRRFQGHSEGFRGVLEGFMGLQDCSRDLRGGFRSVLRDLIDIPGSFKGSQEHSRGFQEVSGLVSGALYGIPGSIKRC